MLLLLLLAAAAASPLTPPAPCSPCQESLCPPDASLCHRGLVDDVCGCCPLGVCRLVEGERCLDRGEAVFTGRYSGCEEGLICLPRTDLSEKDEKESLCVCRDSSPVCGSDNSTRDTLCQLEAEVKSLRTETTLYLLHRGPCVSTPEVLSGPQGTSAVVDHSLALTCEVKGFPVPTVYWEFQSLYGSSRVLPGDDRAVLVQTMGGPGSHTISSWLQVVALRPGDEGWYTCVGRNAEGEVRASARVEVEDYEA